jgi:hypothetical protein
MRYDAKVMHSEQLKITYLKLIYLYKSDFLSIQLRHFTLIERSPISNSRTHVCILFLSSILRMSKTLKQENCYSFLKYN